MWDPSARGIRTSRQGRGHSRLRVPAHPLSDLRGWFQLNQGYPPQPFDPLQSVPTIRYEALARIRTNVGRADELGTCTLDTRARTLCIDRSSTLSRYSML